METRERSHGLRATAWILGCALLLAGSTGPAAQDDPYRRGTRALDRQEWGKAYEVFHELAQAGGDRADAALYWEAYALGKMGSVERALEALERLDERYPSSRWIDDAEKLRVELDGSASVRAEKEELRLMALFSLTQSDPERAAEYLEKFLAGDNSADGKEQALFLAMQTGTPQAMQLVSTIAKGEQSPELQVAAIRSLGMTGDPHSQGLLSDVYRTTGNMEVKLAILEAYMIGGRADRMLEIAENEKNPELRGQAVQYLGATGAIDELSEMYASESSKEVKGSILQGLAMGGGERALTEIVKSEADPELRAHAIQSLAIGGSPSPELLLEIYNDATENEVRLAALEGLALRQYVEPLIAIARSEEDPELKRAAVRFLAMTGSEEATEFLMELLEE